MQTSEKYHFSSYAQLFMLWRTAETNCNNTFISMHDMKSPLFNACTTFHAMEKFRSKILIFYCMLESCFKKSSDYPQTSIVNSNYLGFVIRWKFIIYWNIWLHRNKLHSWYLKSPFQYSDKFLHSIASLSRVKNCPRIEKCYFSNIMKIIIQDRFVLLTHFLLVKTLSYFSHNFLLFKLTLRLAFQHTLLLVNTLCYFVTHFVTFQYTLLLFNTFLNIIFTHIRNFQHFDTFQHTLLLLFKTLFKILSYFSAHFATFQHAFQHTLLLLLFKTLSYFSAHFATFQHNWHILSYFSTHFSHTFLLFNILFYFSARFSTHFIAFQSSKGILFR